MSSYQINQKCFITPLRTDGVVKAVNGDNYTITYFPRNQDKRKTKVFNVSLLSDYRKPIERKKVNNKDNYYFNLVSQFHKSFLQPAPDKPTRLTEERKDARLKWMQEELDEYKASQTLYDDVDAMLDEIYFCIGTLVEMGVKPDPLFEIVNQANMNKLWEDGLPRFNEEGKIIKPSGWVAPEPLLIEEIERQKLK